MKKIKLTSEERKIEKNLLAVVYKSASASKFHAVSEAIAHRKEDVLKEMQENLTDRKVIDKFEAEERAKNVRFYTADEIRKRI